MTAELEEAYGCHATATSYANVLICINGATRWHGVVHVFSLRDHAETQTAYAWLTDFKVHTALKVRTTMSASEAVRASIQ
jgi:hypothetical protein